MVSFLKRFKNWFNEAPKPIDGKALFVEQQEKLDEPWAMFEVVGFEDDGRIKVGFNWNQAFIDRLNSMGFQAETEEDTVQLFFYASQMKPTELTGGDDPVQSDSHPTLSGRMNMK